MAPHEDLLLSRMNHWNRAVPERGAGVYLYATREPLPWPSLGAIGANLYVGRSDSSLAARCHFDHAHSGFSTLRRSLGVLLQNELDLVPRPRAPGPSRSNLLNFRFDDAGEARLTQWMRDTLQYAHAAVDENVAAVEKDLIASLQPVLNLTGWKNPNRSVLKSLRAEAVRRAAAAMDRAR